MRITFAGPRRIAHDGTSGSPLFRKEPPSRGRHLQGNDSKTNSASRARLSSGAVALGSSLRRPAAWKLATAPERTETAGAFQHVSAAAQTERSAWADAGSRLQREGHVTVFAEARLAQDPVPINLNCHGSV